MKDWKAAARNWSRRNKEASRKQKHFTADEMQPAEQDLDELKRRLFGEE